MTATGWPVKDVTQRIYDQIAPLAWADPTTGWHTLSFVNAIGEMFQDIADLVQDGPHREVGWSIVVDIDRVPDEGLGWLAQFLGIRFFVGVDAPTRRQQIRDHISWQRGTPASILAAVSLFLSGTKTVQMTERNGSPYRLQVIIWSSEAPADTSATSPMIRYINAYAKPAGIVMSLTVNPGTPPATTYSAIYTRGDSYGLLYTNYQTYADVR
jgi:hypothetical protein